MDELKKTTKTTHYVDIYDLTEYLSEKIGREVEYGEASNDSDHSITLTKEELAEYDQETVDEFLEDGYLNMDYGWTTVLTYCANQGWLDEGDYIIQISW